MGKVSKKQLGRRRRIALYILILLMILIIILISRCADTEKKKTAEPVSAELSQVDATAPESTTSAMTGILYTGIQSVTTESVQALPEEPETLPDSAVLLEVTPVLQNPELPTGCEITALTMALNYAGYPVDKITMADEWLIRADPYTATFGEAFIGSPHDATAWGCYSPVIVETAKNYIAAQNGTETVRNLTGCSLKTLLNEVAYGTPVVTWASIGMTDQITEKYYWTTPEGNNAVFLKNEHCLLLIGYDLSENTVIVCDPLEGQISYDMTIFEDRYNKVYQQAVVIDQQENMSAVLPAE